MDRTEPAPPPDSQSRLPAVLLWAVIAAAVFRIVTGVRDRPPLEGGLVHWRPREAAAAAARASGRPILYDFTAAWCGPCHLLDREWNDRRVAEKLDAAFVPVRIVDREREDGRNAPDVGALLRRYEVAAFPTLVAASADGTPLGKLEGYAGRERLMRFLEQVGGK